MIRMEDGWRNALASEFDKPYFKSLTDRVRLDYKSGPVFPPAKTVFAAFDASPFNLTKVVIIGQDPYHGPGQANGLAFSVNPGIPIPPSLRNILKEVTDDTGASTPSDGNLHRWASQGVLLLNTALTVKAGQPKSHAGIGWEQFTDMAVRQIANRRDNIVFMLWGADAGAKRAFINPSRHLILTSPHPSPLSAHRGFFGNHHFSRANEYLVSHGMTPIQW